MKSAIKGLGRLNRKLDRIARTNLRIPAVKAARRGVSLIREDTPVETGRLQKAINIVSVKSNGRDVNIKIGPRHRKTGKDPAIYGAEVEKQDPFLVPSFRRNRREMLRTLLSEARPKLSRAAR